MSGPIGWVPPGAPGNPTAAAMPIYASPPRVMTEKEIQLAKEARARDEAAIARLRVVTDPQERLVRALGEFAIVCRNRREGPGGRSGTSLSVVHPPAHFTSRLHLINEVCPGWNRPFAETVSPPADKFVSWFAHYAQAHEIKPMLRMPWPEERKNWRGQPVLRHGEPQFKGGESVGIWRIPGVLFGEWTPPRGSPIARPRDSLISADGRLHSYGRSLTYACLWQMAKWLRFTVAAPDIEDGPEIQHCI